MEEKNSKMDDYRKVPQRKKRPVWNNNWNGSCNTETDRAKDHTTGTNKAHESKRPVSGPSKIHSKPEMQPKQLESLPFTLCPNLTNTIKKQLSIANEGKHLAKQMSCNKIHRSSASNSSVVSSGSSSQPCEESVNTERCKTDRSFTVAEILSMSKIERLYQGLSSVVRTCDVNNSKTANTSATRTCVLNDSKTLAKTATDNKTIEKQYNNISPLNKNYESRNVNDIENNESDNNVSRSPVLVMFNKGTIPYSKPIGTVWGVNSKRSVSALEKKMSLSSSKIKFQLQLNAERDKNMTISKNPLEDSDGFSPSTSLVAYESVNALNAQMSEAGKNVGCNKSEDNLSFCLNFSFAQKKDQERSQISGRRTSVRKPASVCALKRVDMARWKH